MKLLLLLFFMPLFCVKTAAVTCQAKDSLLVMELLKKSRSCPKGTSKMVYLGRMLRGTPYVGHTLEVNKSEDLVVNLRELDCTTFTETVFALCRTAMKKQPTFQDFCNELRLTRYLRGEVTYPRRLHYFTSWITENSRRGAVVQISHNAAPFTKVQKVDVWYMSRYSNKYKMLRDNPRFIDPIRQTERTLTGQTYRYIPKNAIRNTALLRKTIHDGDIIAILTNIPGLDTQHIGIAVWHKDGLHLLNASSIHHKVVEEQMTMLQYLKRHSTMTGIRIARPQI